MKIKRQPILMVRKVSKNFFEYYLEQDGPRVHFFIDLKTHDDLKRAQLLAEMEPGTQWADPQSRQLQIVYADGKQEPVQEFPDTSGEAAKS